MTALDETTEDLEAEYQPDPDYPRFVDDPTVIFPESVFAKAKAHLWKYNYAVSFAITDFVAGLPSNPRVAEGWLRMRLQGNDVALRVMVEQTMAETGTGFDESVEKTISNLGNLLTVFKRQNGNLVFDGKNVKAAIKEAYMVALAAGHFGEKKKWGKTGKGLKSFTAEHIMVPDRFITICHLDGTPFTEPTRIQQRFVHGPNGPAITYEEVCDPCMLNFNIRSDWDFGNEWEAAMVTGEEQGIGACRSQSFGRYSVTRFDKI